MATIKSYSDLQQSKKLAEILPLESADMLYYCGKSNNIQISQYPFIRSFKEKDTFSYLHCWSLSALLGVLPKIQGGKPIIALDDNYITYPHINDLHVKADNLINACYELILKLHELNLL